MKLTAKQQKTLNALREAIERSSARIAHVIKTWELSDEFESFITLTCVTGRENDEGTAAEIYCRDRRYIMIGKNGGCTIYVNGRGGKRVRKTGFFNAVINSER